MYFARESLGPVEVAFTDRAGGRSRAPYDELNLAREGHDDPEVVARNHEVLLEDFAPGCGVADMGQVHGRRVAVAEVGTAAGCDALVTDRPDLVLLVRAADCVPVVLADPVAGLVGAAHSGRAGLAAGVVPAAVRAMVDLGARSEQMTAWIGPHVCGGCYEVPSAMREEVGAVVPAAVASTSWGTPSLDLGAGVRAQLGDAGVHVVDLAACTRERADLYSHRRDGAAAGRLAGLVRRRAS